MIAAMEKTIRILYVDDEPHNLNAFRAYFRLHEDFEIHTCLSGEEGLKVLSATTIDIVISDQRMPEMTGVEFLDSISDIDPEPVKIVVTAHRDTSAIEQAQKEGKIFKYHDKPWKMDDLERSIREAFEVLQSRK